MRRVSLVKQCFTVELIRICSGAFEAVNCCFYMYIRIGNIYSLPSIIFEFWHEITVNFRMSYFSV